MKNVFITLLTLAVVTVNAQDCKFVKNEVDEFEGYYRLHTKRRGVVTPFGGDQVFMGLAKDGDRIYITMGIGKKNSEIMIEMDQELVLKLGDNNIIRGISSMEKESEYYSATMTHELYTEYDISIDDLKSISVSPLVQLRINVKNSELDYKVKNKKKQAFLKNQAICILKNMK